MTEAEGQIRVDWEERASPCKTAPKKDSEGFGSRLLRMAIEGQLGGRFTRSYSDDGLDVEISVPVSSLSD